MLRMPEFQVHLPLTARQAVNLRSTLPESMYIAGGTDLLPNLKHHLHAPQHLVSLSKVVELKGIIVDDSGVRIGAGTSLHDVANHTELAAMVPGLAQAAGLVAGPQHRRMGTLGGNVMQDTRCLFYNQSLEWRTSLGKCLKKDGDWCHVLGSAKACVAAQSSDTVPMLMALDARVEVLRPSGDLEQIALRGLFTKDGRFDQMHTLENSALVIAIVVPKPADGHRSVYRKVRTRDSVDYPQLGIAISASLKNGQLTALEVVVGAMLPQPKRLTKLDSALGRVLDEAHISELAERAFKQVRPQPNIHGSVAWRREMARVETARGLRQIADA
ncbi:MAG: hypothetical protein GWP91_01540 [Rhodobacterales bacterium]|nr:hypothetical protein [Rhodobacterales bacterium]